MANSETENRRWFALQVRTRWESSTAVLLSGKGYETLLPTYQTKKRWNGKVKQASAPLFPGYVFCQFDALKAPPNTGYAGSYLGGWPWSGAVSGE